MPSLRISSVSSAALILALMLASAKSAFADIELASVHALVADLDSGEVLYRKHASESVPIASITKVMTALVVLDAKQSLDEWLTVVGWDRELDKNAYSRLRKGSQLKRGDLLQIALMSSENLATNVLAHHYPGGFDAFVTAMNDKAEVLGMANTQFSDPAGLSPRNRSTAEDLLALGRAAHAQPVVRRFTTDSQHDARFRNPRYDLGYGNTNPLVASSKWQVEMSKTGYLTEAGRCLLMAANVDGRNLLMVFLNSFGKRSPLGDAGRVRRWITTGDSGPVSAEAREYERRTAERYRSCTDGGVAIASCPFRDVASDRS